MGVYLWTDTAYIPTANTIAYYPFSSDGLDVTWNTTISNTWTQDWLWRKFTSSSALTYTWTIQYVNMWIKINSYYTSGNPSWVCVINNIWTWYYTRHNSDTNLRKKIFVWSDSSFNIWGSVSFAPTAWTWHNISYWHDGAKTIYSIDGVTWTLYNWKWYNFETWFNIVGSRPPDAVFSNLIIENVCWSSQDILNYYNQTKATYWIS